MSYFSALTAADRISFEGSEVAKITPLKDRGTDSITHYAFTVVAEDKSATIRKFASDEISYLLESELLTIDRGYHIHRRGPWRSFETVEYATLEWVDWFNNRRLLEPVGNIPPAEAEANFYAALEIEATAA